MNCRNCAYPLWNLGTRTCPECGEPFKPSDVEFVVNSVRFCCPHCDQEYYGTTASGHLDPPRFQCVRCQRDVNMDEMVLRPAEGVDEGQTRLDSMPWLERDRRGLFKAWFATIGAAMVRPQSLMRAVPEDISLSRAWSFMYVNNLVFYGVGQAIPFLIFAVGFGLVATRFGLPPGLGRMMTIQSIVQSSILLVMLAFAPILWGWTAHGLMRLSGWTGRGLNRTWHAVMYSAAARGLSAVPCFDAAGQIWWLVSSILMFKEAHRCGGGRATFAVLTAAIIVFAPLTVVIGLAPLLLIGGPGFAGSGGMFGGRSETGAMVQHVLGWAGEHENRWPAHPGQLLVAPGEAEAAGPGRGINPGSFVCSETSTSVGMVPLGDVTLEQFRLRTEARRRDAVEAAVAAVPEDVVVQRLGDYVFTYHGIDLDDADVGLWVVLMIPDPDQNRTAPLTPLYAGRVDGSVVSFTAGELGQRLQAQNELRAKAGLPPLPDPRTLGH